MNVNPEKDTSASVRARLLNLARSKGRDFQELTVRYVVERFLSRLAESEYREQFILKGAMLYIPWKIDDKRTTMDLDLLGFGSPDLENLKTVFQEICDISIEDDGLIFNKESISVNQIREDSIYDGVRIIVRVNLGSMLIRLQIDIGFGDQIVPAPQESEFPALLAEHGPIIRAYSPETVIAEKFNAMIVLGMANSRMKDYFDIWMLSRSFIIDADVLREAIRQTFYKRQTELPQDEPIALSDDFFRNDSKQSQWKGFIRRQRRLESAPSLEGIIEVLRVFLLPVVFETGTGARTIKTWSPEKGWSIK